KNTAKYMEAAVHRTIVPTEGGAIPSNDVASVASGERSAAPLALALDRAVRAALSREAPPALVRFVHAGTPPVAAGSTTADWAAVDWATLRPRLDALLVARHADVGLDVLLDTGFIAAVLPELGKIVGFGDGESHKDVWRHTKQVVIQSVPRLAVRW